MKLIIRLLVLVILVGIVLAIFAPSVLSTQFGKNSIFKILKSMSGYEIHSDSLKLQWMGEQEAQKITILDQQGKRVFTADQITSTAPLWKLLFYHDVGSLNVQSPFAVIDPPHSFTSKLMVQQAGFALAVSFTPSFDLLGEINVTNGSAEFVTTGLEPIVMKDVEIEATLLPKQIKLSSSGAAGEGTFQIGLLAYPGSDQIDASLKLTSFPLRAVDQLVTLMYPDLKGIVREAIGETFDADLKLKNLKEGTEVYLKAKSDYFSANLETTVQDGRLELTTPALFQFQIPATSLQKFPIKNGINAQIKIDQLSANPFSLQGTLKSDALNLGEWTVEPFTLFVGSATAGEWNINIDSPQVQFKGNLTLPEKWELLSFTGQALLPNNTKLDLNASSLKAITIAVQGDQWKGRFKGAFDPFKKTVSLTEAGALTVQMEKLPYSLPNLPLQVTLQPTTISLDPLAGPIKGVAETASFQMGTATVAATQVQFSGDLKTKKADFTLTTKVDNGPLTADGTWAYPTDLKLKGSCKDFPVTSLQPFLAGGPPLLPLIGTSLTTNFQANWSETARFIALNTTSPLLSMKATLKGDDKNLTLLEPASFKWTLTPDGYATISKWLQGSAALTLSQPSVFNGTVDSFSFNSDQLLYQGKIATDQLSFGTSKVTALQASFSHPVPTSPHQFQISAAAAPQGKLSCQGTWTPQGTADVNLLFEQFPSAMFDLFTSPLVGSRFSLEKLCGPLLNLTLNTTLNNWSGPLKFELHSPNLRSSLQGVFKEGILTLSDKFHLQMNVTHELSQMFSDGTSFRSEGPVTLEIAPQGFSYPLFPSNLSKLQIGSGRLELGKILCKNEGNLQTTLGLLKKGSYRSGDDLELWFAPLDFKVQNGTVNCDRTEILIVEEFQVCLWGDVNLPQESVDGILGLTSSCLKSAFGIKGLPENYVLQIPVYGSISDVKIDKGKATTKIGALMLWQQKDAVGNVVKGPAGKLLGGTLNQLGPLPGGDQKAPPPKKPFPWETDTPTTSKKKTSDASHERKTHLDPRESALKQVLKLLR